MDAETSDTRLAVHDPAADFRGIEGLWSKSAKSVYYVKCAGPADSQIRELRFNGGPDRLLYETDEDRSSRLSLSRGGAGLVFLRGRPGAPEALLYVLRMDEGKLRRFVSSPAGAVESIGWSTGDERLLAGVSSASGPELWNIPFKGAMPTRSSGRPRRQEQTQCGPRETSESRESPRRFLDIAGARQGSRPRCAGNSTLLFHTTVSLASAVRPVNQCRPVPSSRVAVAPSGSGKLSSSPPGQWTSMD